MKHFVPTTAYVATAHAVLLSRARAGCALLDSVDSDWRQKIDLGRLDVESLCDCTLAQAGGKNDFWETTFELDLDCDDVVRYGFFVNDRHNARRSWKYAMLTEIWQDLVIGHRTPEPLPDYRAPANERVLQHA